jgi:hypothetical protein
MKQKVKTLFKIKDSSKGYITEDKIVVNPKYVRPTKIANRARSIITFKNEEKREARMDRVNFWSALRPAGMSRHNQQRSGEEGRARSWEEPMR